MDIKLLVIFCTGLSIIYCISSISLAVAGDSSVNPGRGYFVLISLAMWLFARDVVARGVVGMYVVGLCMVEIIMLELILGGYCRCVRDYFKFYSMLETLG